MKKTGKLVSRQFLYALLCLPLVVLASGNANAHAGDEGFVRSLYILNFSRLIRWPDRFSTDDFRLCVLENEADVYLHLKDFTGEIIKHRKVQVQRQPGSGDVSDCDVLYIGRSEQSRLEEVLDAAHDRPILTISDIPGFIRRGGMIELKEVDGVLQFLVNPDCANDAGLVLESQLIVLALNQHSAASLMCI